MTTKFTVRGSGSFPVDMLRFDAAWPANAEAVHAIESTRGERTVELYTARPQGYNARRWDSFNWHVLEAKDPCEWCGKAPRREGTRTCSSQCSDDWIAAGV